jgi:hypothetical protein
VLKRLILCLDGTWNTADSQQITNIVRIRDLIAPKVSTAAGAEEQRIYYHTGVGTGLSMRDKVIGGAVGSGLAHNVRAAYRYLSHQYEADVEIYIFGFSRGAFTARSLAGYIGASGLLKADHCSAENEERAWRYYLTSPDDRFPKEAEALARLSYDTVRIRLLGVFDTVGALGVPLEALGNWNARRFQFHNVTLGSNIDFAFHALAIDEKRGPFKPSLWQLPYHRGFRFAEQVWFPGVHSNIGGGYEDRGLSDRTLFWMLSRIEKHQLGLVLLDDWRDAVSPKVGGELYESRTPAYQWSRYRPMIRIINQLPKELAVQPTARRRVASLPPHAIPIGEAVDYSALARWRLSEEPGARIPRYQPINLKAALDATFVATAQQEQPQRAGIGAWPVPIVDPQGEPYNWLKDEHQREVLKSFLPDEYKALCDKTAKAVENVPTEDVSEFWNFYQESKIRWSQRIGKGFS